MQQMQTIKTIAKRSIVQMVQTKKEGSISNRQPFYHAVYIENWGRGIQKICDACKNLGVDEPEYIVHGEDIMVKFKALQSAIVSNFKDPKPQNDALNDALGDKLLILLKKNPNLTQKEMVEKLSVSRATVQRLIKKLIDEKKLERVGGKRYGYWVIHEYCL